MCRNCIAFLVLAALAFGAATFFGSSPLNAAVEIGKPAPAFDRPDTNGTPQRLADYAGNIVVLEWKNHDCPFVKKHYGGGNMQTLQKELRDQGIVWLSVISSAPGKQGHVSAKDANNIAAAEASHASAIILDPDGTLGKAYGAKTTPHMFVINATGQLAYMGAIDDKRSADQADIAGAKNYVRTAVTELLAGKAVTNPATSPYGCSVKY